MTRRPGAAALALALLLGATIACSDDDDDGEAAVEAVDEASPWRLTALAGRPSAVAADQAGGIVVVDDEQGLLQRLGPDGAVADSVVLGGALVAVDVHEGVAYAADAHGIVHRVGTDGATLRSGVLGEALVDLDAEGSVWVGDLAAGAVHQLDGDTLEPVVAPVVVPDGVVRLAFMIGVLWVTGLEASVTPLDAARNWAPGAPVPTGAGPIGVEVGGGDGPPGSGSVWVANSDDDSVTRIDVPKGRPPQRIPVGDAPIAVSVSGDHVWVLDQDGLAVTHLDAATGARVGADVPLPPELRRPRGLAATEAGVWVVGVDASVAAFLPLD